MSSVENILPFNTKPTVELVMVTPAMATQWLEKNTANRNIRQATVNKYARDMANGNWRLTAEPVKFAVGDRLLDGQHRLWGVVEADTIVPLFVARGLPDDTQAYMDSGIGRTAGDHLGMRGEANAPMLAATARIGCIVDRDLLFRNRQLWAISKSDIYQWVDDNPGARRSVAFVASGEPKKVPLPPSIKAYAHFRFSQADTDAADQFFTSLGSLINIQERSAVHALSSRLRQLEKQRVRVELPDALSVTFRAWNAHRQGRSMAVIPLVPSRGQRDLPEVV